MFNFGLFASHVPYAAVFAAYLIYLCTLSYNKVSANDEADNLNVTQAESILLKSITPNSAVVYLNSKKHEKSPVFYDFIDSRIQKELTYSVIYPPNPGLKRDNSYNLRLFCRPPPKL